MGTLFRRTSAVLPLYVVPLVGISKFYRRASPLYLPRILREGKQRPKRSQHGFFGSICNFTSASTTPPVNVAAVGAPVYLDPPLTTDGRRTREARKASRVLGRPLRPLRRLLRIREKRAPGTGRHVAQLQVIGRVLNRSV